IDTPGHVDFTYEVSRSLSACEGALVLVDAAQGVEAQTVANVHLALNQNLTIIPVINKIDLPSADPEKIRDQIEDILCIESHNAILASAKLGIGTVEILEAIVERIPAPKNIHKPELRALIFDSFYDTYKGVIVYVRLFSGEVQTGQKIKMMSTHKVFEVTEVGIFKPNETPVEKLLAGDVGYFVANIKIPGDVRIGDTVTDQKKPAAHPLPGYKEVKPMVFSGFYPIDSEDYEMLKTAMEKLKLNDSSFFYEMDNSIALGFGFRCGFLGLLHMEIIQERLEREYGVSIIATAPSVVYRLILKNGNLINIDNPIHYPDPSTIEKIEEPFIRAYIIAPGDCIGALMNLALDRRGECTNTETLDNTRVMLTFELPLSEIVTDFYDKLKSLTHGYGSLDYEIIDYREGEMVKLDILINNEPIDPFSTIVHRSKAESKGRALAARLKEVI
ncbi:MAG: elongation factor 4, partial [Chlamydiia bacterium]|nr:elongation factor 4 [Chlamydiia bacterium]